MDDATLERLLAEATPGGWQVEGTRHTGDLKIGANTRLHFVGPDGEAVAAVFYDMTTGRGYADARLIAIAPDLAAEVLRLRASEKRKCADCMGLFNELAAEAEANAAEIARLRAVEKAAKDMAVALDAILAVHIAHHNLPEHAFARAALAAFNATQEGV